MDTCKKNWENYYNYYNNKNFENDIILKCDHDIVFVDLYKLPKFIDFITPFYISNADLLYMIII